MRVWCFGTRWTQLWWCVYSVRRTHVQFMITIQLALQAQIVFYFAMCVLCLCFAVCVIMDIPDNRNTCVWIDLGYVSLADAHVSCTPQWLRRARHATSLHHRNLNSVIICRRHNSVTQYAQCSLGHALHIISKHIDCAVWYDIQARITIHVHHVHVCGVLQGMAHVTQSHSDSHWSPSPSKYIYIYCFVPVPICTSNTFFCSSSHTKRCEHSACHLHETTCSW